MSNIKRTRERLELILKLVSEGHLQPTKVAKMADVDYETLGIWRRKSAGGDKALLVNFMGEEIQFADAFLLARKYALSELRGKFEREGIFGWDEVAREKGQVVWRMCPVAAAIKPELRELLGHREDALLVIDGALQPELIHHKAPVAQSLRILETEFRDYKPSSTQEVTIQGSVGIQHAKKVDYSGQAPRIPPPPLELPQLEVIDVEPAQINIVISPTIVVADEPEPEPAPEPAPAPAAPDRKPLTELQAKLWAEYRENRARNGAQLPEDVGAEADDDADDAGADVPPGGTSIKI
jgi:hypothetical protein